MPSIAEDGASVSFVGDNWEENNIYIIWDAYANESLSVAIA